MQFLAIASLQLEPMALTPWVFVFRAGSVGDERFSSAAHYNSASKMDALLLQLP
jgi:hypothetical protein